MSRAMNVTSTISEVTAAAAKNKATISAIEAILSGGTRVVFCNGEDATRMRTVFGKRLITGNVTRTRWVRNS